MSKVEIREHACNWEEIFAEEARAIKNRLKNLFFIDHVGSTSVPGLPAKPIIDILISIPQWASSNEISEVLQGLGYHVREKCLETPRLFLVKYSSEHSIGYHVHICEPHNKWARDMLDFKEELFANEKLASSYANLKKRLAQAHFDDIESYALGKKDFIEEALRDRVCKFNVDRLLTHQNVELDKADYYRKWMLKIQILVAFGAIISVFPDSGGILLLIAMVGFVLLAIWLCLNQFQQKHRAAGDRARRVVLFMSGLDRWPSLEEQQRILRNFILPISGSKLSLEESRFASREYPGYKRLAELIEESAFWTADLYHASARWMGMFLRSSLFICFASIIASIILAPQEQLISFNRALIAAMVLIVSSDVLGLFFLYRKSAIALDEVFHRTEIASLRGYLEADVLLLASDYNAVIDNAPSPLSSLIRSRSKTLEQQWSVYKETKRGRKLEGLRS